MIDGIMYMRKCFVCRKKFEVQNEDMWVYKKGRRFFCSYGCMRRFERAKKDQNEPEMSLGKFADELFDVGGGHDEVKFKVIGTTKYIDDYGFQQTTEVCEIGQLYDVSRSVDGKITITLEING